MSEGDRELEDADEVTVSVLEGRPFLREGNFAHERHPEIEGYRVVARVSESRATNVYLAYRRERVGNARRVVLKWVPKNRPSYVDDRVRLLDEALAMSFLDHPNIARLVEAGEINEGSLLAVEYVEGVDLRRSMTSLIARGERLPVELCVHVILEVLRGLDHVHQATTPNGEPLGIVHRDATPSNVLISTSGHVVLADFGIVRMRGRLQDPTAPGMVKGKFRYLAPELVKNGAITQRVDLYSTGVMLFELLTGNFWAQGPTSVQVMKRIVDEGLPLETLAQIGAPSELCGVVALATEKEPSRRFSSAKEMMSAMESWMIQRGAYVSPSILAGHFASRGLFG
jgi:serine/threonine protein kinase